MKTTPQLIRESLDLLALLEADDDIEQIKNTLTNWLSGGFGFSNTNAVQLLNSKAAAPFRASQFAEGTPIYRAIQLTRTMMVQLANTGRISYAALNDRQFVAYSTNKMDANYAPGSYEHDDSHTKHTYVFKKRLHDQDFLLDVDALGRELQVLGRGECEVWMNSNDYYTTFSIEELISISGEFEDNFTIEQVKADIAVLDNETAEYKREQEEYDAMIRDPNRKDIIWAKVTDNGEREPEYGIGNVFYYYIKDGIVNEPWPKAEPYILEDPSAIVLYAQRCLKHRWPKGETALLDFDMSTIEYAVNVIKGRWPALEQQILVNKNWDQGEEYAEKVLHGKWPELEQLKATS
jgi:hypothetical protein